MAKIFLVALICISSFTFSKAAINKEKLIKQFLEYSEQCLQEVGAAKSDIEDVIKHVPATGVEGKCLRACLFKKYKLIDENGKFVKSVAIKHAKDLTQGDPQKLKIATEITDACAGIAVSDNHCEAAEAYGNCFKEQAQAHGIEKVDF